MKRTLILLVMMVLLLTAMCLASDSTAVKPHAPMFRDLDSAKMVAAKDGRLIIADFYTDW
jgi:hypothetical protein